jgi:hypothetical protein
MISMVSRTWACRRGNRWAALAAANSSGIQPGADADVEPAAGQVVLGGELGGEHPGDRYGVSMMLMPIRTFEVFAASQGISVMPWNHLPREITGRAFGRSAHHPNGYCSSRGRKPPDDDPVERPDGVKSRSSARRVRSSSSLTVTSSRKFGR